MRALRGLAWGALVGLLSGVITALTIATGIAAVAVSSGDVGEGLFAFFLVATYGVVVGGAVGTVVGAPVGLILGAAGLEVHARWITSGLMVVLVGLITVYTAEGPLDLVGLAVAAFIATALGLLGFVAGVCFGRAMAAGSTPPAPAQGAVGTSPTSSAVLLETASN